MKLLDFGLAKQRERERRDAADAHERASSARPSTWRPSSARGRPVGPRTDLYALGVVAFEMLTGRLPFPGRSPMEKVTGHPTVKPAAAPSSFVVDCPRSSRPRAPAAVKEPALRPASASEVARELKAMAKMLAAEMTQLSGFARAMPEPEPPSVRPPARQEAAAPQRGAPAPRPPVAPPETVGRPKTVQTGSRNAVAPPASARPPPGRAQAPARPQAARAQAPAPQTEMLPAEVPNTAEMVPVGRSSSRMKMLAGVGAAVVLPWAWE